MRGVRVEFIVVEGVDGVEDGGGYFEVGEIEVNDVIDMIRLDESFVEFFKVVSGYDEEVVFL